MINKEEEKKMKKITQMCLDRIIYYMYYIYFNAKVVTKAICILQSHQFFFFLITTSDRSKSSNAMMTDIYDYKGL